MTNLITKQAPSALGWTSFGMTLLGLAYSGDAFAQGLPTENGPNWPVGLIFAGAVILGLVLAYGIIRNRSRTPLEKQLTDDVTAKRYRTNTTTE